MGGEGRGGKKIQFYISKYTMLGRWVRGGGGRFNKMTVGNILKSHTPNMLTPNKYKMYGFAVRSKRYYMKM